MTPPLAELVAAIAAMLRRDRRMRFASIVAAAGLSAIAVGIALFALSWFADTVGRSPLYPLLSLSLLFAGGAAGFIYLAFRLDSEYRINAAAAIACLVCAALLVSIVTLIPKLARIPEQERSMQFPITIALAIGMVGVLGVVLAIGAVLGGLVAKRRMSVGHRPTLPKHE